MAALFLSYAREDIARATRVAQSLESVGHEVWWDRRIGTGTRYSTKISEALDRAELVVVLWSKHSVNSDWVRDEAAAGRDSGRLVPVQLDRSEPPLGFRQYQSLKLPLRGGLHALQAAVADRLGEDAPSPPSPAVGMRHRLPRTISLVIAVALLLAAAGFVWLRRGAPAESLAVVALDTNPQSLVLTRSLARDLGQYRAGPLGRLTIYDGSDAKAGSSGYRLEIAVAGIGDDRQADLSLKQGSSGLLWSGVVDHPQSGGDLRQKAATKVGAALNCLVELDDWRNHIDQAGLAQFLTACVAGDDPEALAIFRQMTGQYPRFGPGWANLAMVEAFQLPFSARAEIPAMIAEVKAALAKAKRLAPDYPETIVADALVHPSGGTKEERQLALLDRGILRHPDSPLLHGARVDSLQSLGRMDEAVQAGQRAFTLNPLSVDIFESYVGALAYSGRTGSAMEKLADAGRNWPGSPQIAQLAYRMNLRFADPQAAKAYLATDDQMKPTERGAWLAFLDARIDPKPVKVDAAVRQFRAQYDASHGQIFGYLQALATFGRVDDAYAALDDPVAIDSLSSGMDVLFRPYMATMRADPRFIKLAKQLGLVDAWQRTRVWPDFCREPGLPYRCQAEARKVARVKVVSP